MAKPLGMVRVWKEDEQWKWVPAGKWAPEHAELGERRRDEGEVVIYIDRGEDGELIRGAVKG